MLECFKSNGVYLNRPNQQKVTVFCAASWVRPVVEQNLFKGYSTDIGWYFVSLNKTMLECFKSNSIRLNKPNQQKLIGFILTLCVRLVMEQKFFEVQNSFQVYRARTLFFNNKITLECFKSNSVYLNRPNQQKPKVFWTVSWVQLVVEQNSFKDTV